MYISFRILVTTVAIFATSCSQLNFGLLSNLGDDFQFYEKKTGIVNDSITNLPGLPSINRNLAPIQQDGAEFKFKTPHIPPLRTTADGRIGINIRTNAGRTKNWIVLLSPEKYAVEKEYLLADDGFAMGDLIADAVLADKEPEAPYPESPDPDDTSRVIGQPRYVGDSGKARMMTVCDATHDPVSNGGTTIGNIGGSALTNQPEICVFDHDNDSSTPLATMDCYKFKIITGSEEVNEQEGDPQKIVLFSQEVTVKIKSPKTENATIHEVVFGDVSLGKTITIGGTGNFAFLEPMITNDGRLLVARVASEKIVEGNDTAFDLAYTMNHAGDPCDVSQWGNENGTEDGAGGSVYQGLRPITTANTDPRLKNRYGFAKYPFRDSTGEVITAGSELKVTYPWIDRFGRNIFFTMVGSTLSHCATTVNDVAPVDKNAQCTADTTDHLYDNISLDDTYRKPEEKGITRGIGFAGLWSHGKMVLLDTPLNNTDFSLGLEDKAQRLVKLYNETTQGDCDEGAEGEFSWLCGWVRLGASRLVDQGPTISVGNGIPLELTWNTTFIDSIENLFNDNQYLRPVTPRDVVWTMSSGRSSDEIAFDDYINPNGFIVSNMVPATEHKNVDTNDLTGTSTNFVYPNEEQHFYHKGWLRKKQDGVIQFQKVVRIQNSATALATTWKIPKYGSLVHQNSIPDNSATPPPYRVEMAALGGVKARGLWLDGNTRLRYEIPSGQPNNPDTKDWFMGIFIDPRFAVDEQDRLLVRFPDMSKLVLNGLSKLKIIQKKADGSHEVKETIELGNQSLIVGRYTHIGIESISAGNIIRIYINGSQISEHSLAKYDGSRFFLITATDSNGNKRLDIGKVDNYQGFPGWIDEFKLIISEHNPEVICNYARGTLARVDDTGFWNDTAEDYDDSYHARIRSLSGFTGQAKFACYHDYTKDYGAHLGNIPSELTSVRQKLLMPEGLFFDVPRQDSTQNQFCTSCHHDNGEIGLSVGRIGTGLSLEALGPHPNDPNTPAKLDFRRQPMQPPPIRYGVGKDFIDRLLLPPWCSSTPDCWTTPVIF